MQHGLRPYARQLRHGQLTSETRGERGRRGETLAAAYLRAQGFVIEGTNVRVTHGRSRLEIDLVATKDDLVVIVEVRLRGPGALVSPLASIDAKKRERLVRAATELYRTTYAAREMRLRFDVVAIEEDALGRTRIEHVEGAFTA